MLRPLAPPTHAPRTACAAVAEGASGPSGIAETDGELLRLFTRRGDAAALEKLLDRHGAMVWRVCRSVLRRQEDAEDAYQATFLLLVRGARRIGASDSAAGWLFRVAHRTSLRARKRLAQRREEALDQEPAAPPEREFPDLWRRQLAGVLAEELELLPNRYRAPLVMRYLEGRSRRAIAEATDTTIQTVQGRLSRGKQILRRRLVCRGVTLATAMAAVTHRHAEAASAVPSHVTLQTASNATALATGGSLSASAAVLSLFREGTLSMLLATMTKPALAAACGLAAITLMARAETPLDVEKGVTLSAEVAEEAPDAPEATLELAAEGPANDSGPKTRTPLVERRETTIEVPIKGDFLVSYAREPGVVWSGPDGAANAQVLQKLSQRAVSDDRYAGALEGLLEKLKSEYGVATWIDRRSLDESGLGPDEPVVFDPQGLTLRAALEMTLQPLGLVATAHRGALSVTTADVESNLLEVALYPVGDLINPKQEEELVQTLQAMVAPDSWAANGGGNAEARLLSSGTLAVSQTQRLHGEIAALLESLRRVRDPRSIVERKILSRYERVARPAVAPKTLAPPTKPSPPERPPVPAAGAEVPRSKSPRAEASGLPIEKASETVAIPPPAVERKPRSRVSFDGQQFGENVRGGNNRVLHEPSAINPAGWATIAHLAIGGEAPILLPGDERPRPSLVVRSGSEDEWLRLKINAPGTPRDQEEFGLEHDNPRHETIAGQSVEVWHRTIPADAPSSSPYALVIVRQLPESGEALPPPDASEALELLYDKLGRSRPDETPKDHVPPSDGERRD